MAFNYSLLLQLDQFTRLVDARNNSKNEKKSLGSVGYPDLFYPKSFSNTLLTKYSSCIEPNNSAFDWHHLKKSEYQYFNLEKFILERNWNFSYLDIIQGTGNAKKNLINLDLNESIPDNLYSGFDILIDSGTAEHCFNIGKVFENYFQLLKPGGILIQYIPFLSPNHGFWSANPTLCFDLMNCNPIKLLDVRLTSYSSYHDYFNQTGENIPFNDVGRFTLPPGDHNIVLMMFIYKKLKKSIFQFPTQFKYRSKVTSS